MAKATTTIRQSLNYQPQYAHYFAENAALFNRVVSFYFDCIQAHEGILALSNKEALTALERLTHETSKHASPILPLTDIAPDIPAMFRRAAINAALGSARSFCSHLKKWRTRKSAHEAKPGRLGKKKKPFRERPPVPPHRRQPDSAALADEPNQKAMFHRPIPGKLARQIIDTARDMFEETIVTAEVMDQWYTDRNDNSLDFTLQPPSPQHRISPPASCGAPTAVRTARFRRRSAQATSAAQSP